MINSSPLAATGCSFRIANAGVCQSDSVEEGAEIVGAKESSNAPSSSGVDRRAKRAWQWL